MTDAGTELRVGFKVQLVGLVLKRVDRVHMARRKPPSRDETQKRRFLRKTVCETRSQRAVFWIPTLGAGLQVLASG